MLVSDILEEVREATGKSDLAFNLRTITRAVQLLANKGLIDPLVGYFDFTVSDDYFVALPRDVKTPLRININNTPTFSRSRIYEFHINSNGTTTGEDAGLSWADRGYSPIQNEKSLPGVLRYKVAGTSDHNKTCTVTGLDADGREHTETLTGHSSTPTAGAITFHKITRVVREATNAEAFLWCNGTNVAGQYYADETAPDYRVIKLSKAAASVRVMFRRHVFTVRTADDFIPMNSELAVIQACKAVRYIGTEEGDKGVAFMAIAEQFLREEQASREENNTIAAGQEAQPAIDATIYTRDGIIVADLYDVAANIFGAIGRRQLFDKITTATELLSNRAQWDPRLGIVDVFTADNTEEVTYNTPVNATTGRGHGYYVLPRHVETPVAINYRCTPTIPRNRWFEFHLNGDGGMRDFSPCGAWDDIGEVCLCRLLPLDVTQEPKDRGVLPTYLVAVPDNSGDNGKEVRMYGFERDANGRDIEVWRNGTQGWLCPCVAGSYDPGAGAPRWVRVDRITKAESTSFIRLYATEYTPEVPEADNWVNLGSVSDDGGIADPEVEITVLSGLPVVPEVGDEVRDVLSRVGVIDSISELSAIHTRFRVETPTTYDPNAGEMVQINQPIPEVPGFWATGELYGFWYPDEVEPKYRMVRLNHRAPARIRLLYRKRTPKFTSLTEPVPLRSRYALEQAMRGMKAGEQDPGAAEAFIQQALRALRDEKINLGPAAQIGLFQFDPATAPGFTGNVQ